MTNGEKYVTLEQRAKAFDKWCNNRTLFTCDFHNCNTCRFVWLDMEAEEEKPLPCPFCGSMCEAKRDANVVKCDNCSYTSTQGWRMEYAIAAHNRVVRAVMEAEKKEKRDD